MISLSTLAGQGPTTGAVYLWETPMPSPHDEMRIKALGLLAHGHPVTHHWQPADGIHTLTIGGESGQTFKGKDLSEVINHAAEWVKAQSSLT